MCSQSFLLFVTPAPDGKLSCTHSASVLQGAITNIDTCYDNVNSHRKIFTCSNSVFKDNCTLKRDKAAHTNKLHTYYRSKEYVFQQATMFSISIRYSCSLPPFSPSYLLPMFSTSFTHKIFMFDGENEVNPYSLHSHQTAVTGQSLVAPLYTRSYMTEK